MNPLLYQPPGKNQIWANLQGSSLSLALAEYCQNTDGVKLIIAPNNHAAVQIKEEMGFFMPGQELLFFPDWETLPYDVFSPHQDIISERLMTLNRLQDSRQAIVISSISTLMHRLCPLSFIHQYALFLHKDQKLDMKKFRNRLQDAGYRFVNKVMEHGEFTQRGSIIDLFPMGCQRPFRIELFDDSIESLRLFDPETQCTVKKMTEIEILPAREFSIDQESKARFRQLFREQFPGNPGLCPVYEAVSADQFPGGIEYWLPLFFEKTASFFDYLPNDAKICLIGHSHEQALNFWEEIQQRYEQRRYDISRPILPPKQLFLQPHELATQLNNWQQLHCYQEKIEKKKPAPLHFAIDEGPNLLIDRRASEPFSQLKAYCSVPDHRYLLVVESAGRREVLMDLLKPSLIKPEIQAGWSEFRLKSAPISIIIGPLSSGFVLHDANLSVIVEAQLFGESATPQRKGSSARAVDPDLIIRNMAELTVNTPVVHYQFGVGRYLGLEFIEHEGIANEFLVLAYADGDRIYVPVTSLHLVSRYTGSDNPPLHKLGSDKWQKDKAKALEKIHDVAIELLEIYAKRESKPGHRYQIDQDEYQRFSSAFPFTETPDQLQAIAAIIQDLQSQRPMDRLICGDVGFGKTEVAMRAAFIAVHNSRQVCVLVPTTLLAAQHFNTFSDRFAEFPIRIGLLSRFRTGKELEITLEQLKNGALDIVIGTHKLFQKEIKFKDLGLLIIDEEHRFGVRQKEHIRSLRTHIDILSMTATPIPRTLNMAMSGLRDISLIATPPSRRLSIKTFWQEKRADLIREAILREILRGGQVFFLHNRVETIYQIEEELKKLVPEAKIGIAHGQMREKGLEQIMSDFYHHRFNVLLCTTIIETGIDIPTANTIIINRADTFGLAQLHQLRGRVGRSHHQAYAWLLTPPKGTLTADAVKRLEALISLEDLGSGFTLASHDLEIRGAGELLGEEQSGNMQAIGFTLFMELLDKIINDLKSGKTPELTPPTQQRTEIEMHMAALIPEDYLPDVHNRLIMYKRIAYVENAVALDELEVEMIDRFGLMPVQVKQLFAITRLKLKATKTGIRRIRVREQQGKLEFADEPAINPAVLIELIQMHPKRYRLDGPSALRFVLNSADNMEKIEEIAALLLKLKAET